MLDASLNGFAINESAINASGYEEVQTSVAVADMTLAGFLEGQLSGVVSGDSLAVLQLVGEGSITLNPSSQGTAALALEVLAEPTLNPSSDGIADLLLDVLAAPTLNPSSQGVAGLDLIGIADITVSGGAESSGVASMVLGASIYPDVWTYIYSSGLAPMVMTGLVNREYRPPIPATFYPAFDRFEVGGDGRLGDVREDGSTMQVPEGRQRLNDVEADSETMLVPEGRQRLEVPEER